MNKLVRDRIPEILESAGVDDYAFSTAERSEYLSRLIDKLEEESQEFREHSSLEELADICEVIKAILKVKGISRIDLEQEMNDKRAIKGGFDKMFIMADKDKME